MSPAGVDHEGPVGDFFSSPHRQRADVDHDACFTRNVAHGRERRVALLGPDFVEQRSPAALDKRGHLGRLDVMRAPRGRLPHERGRIVAVLQRVAAGAHARAGGHERAGRVMVGLCQAASSASSSPRLCKA